MTNPRIISGDELDPRCEVADERDDEERSVLPQAEPVREGCSGGDHIQGTTRPDKHGRVVLILRKK